MYKYRYFAVFLYVLIFIGSIHFFQIQLSNPIIEDHGRLLPVKMKAIKSSDDEDELRKIIREAKKNADPISISGMQHSQGGQTLYPNGILLDMKSYNNILKLDKEKKLITVQSGVTWADIQSYINPYGLALKVSQSQNIFTVGGSLSVNVHGRDIAYTSLIESVESFRLLNAEGNIMHVSRQENPALFQLVIGGYGLFGVILDVTLQLTDDELYQIRTTSLTFDEYSAYFKTKVLQGEAVKMHLARISVAPESFLTEMYTTDYYMADDQGQLELNSTLKRESLIAIPKFFLGLSRLNGWGKNLLWKTQEAYNHRIDDSYISRNNVMRSESTFMEYENVNKTEVLQEYFVPIDQFTSYIDDLRKTLEQEENFNLLNITVRYVKKNEEAVMSYAKEDMFGLVMLINQGSSKESIDESGRIIRKMIDITLDHDGSYYLPYYHFPTEVQLEEAYPRTEEFFNMKKEYDPDGRFKNLFYEEYHK
ncbi:FAD-binding protein [Psychrobacillus lasiicapitis]|uniref:FAD-binding oxidoreductase n=1 Tax=Psychrobacillus lasiicapitis TaxID=1636719 RepID=A0A544SZL9_9BACI|nr:FAD-binding oxidoreductase [Psychrobacillus lasiicapitis]TQR10641.1 FAD-binding oxidoreductase [Psychrobacillus lasiicapitis]GGA43832.1 L-gulonolactone oxidase [Psychrobacillus lasiicapitis]